jgi:hypothetical protein
MKKLLLILTLCLSFAAQAGLLYTYNRLALKNLDQMNRLVKDKIKESHNEGGDKTLPLRDALQAVYSRPNEDFMIEKILSPLRAELDDYGAWDKSVKALVREALGALKNPTGFKIEAQVTYAIFLENLISDMRPKAENSFEKSILEQIRDANIELTNAAKSERKLRMMRELVSPSDLARAALESAAEKPKVQKSPDVGAGDSGLGNSEQLKKIDKSVDRITNKKDNPAPGDTPATDSKPAEVTPVVPDAPSAPSK